MNTTAPITSPDQIDHSQMVAKLAKDGAQILSELTKEKCHLWHMATGLVGEAIEAENFTDNENLIEELGDVLFYHEGTRQALGLTHSEISGQRCPEDLINDRAPSEDSFKLCVYGAGIVLDAVKKHVAYNQALKKDHVSWGLFIVGHAVSTIRLIKNLGHDQVLLANKTKLFKRYTGFNYTNEAAQARADKA